MKKTKRESKDTRGKTMRGARNRGGPHDVAVIHHYFFKSQEEYIWKRLRGDVWFDSDMLGVFLRNAVNGLDGEGKPLPIEVGHDDTAWKAMKKLLPKYSIYDQCDT